MKKLNFRKLYFPDSPVFGSSTRRNCPCCEESWDLAALDTPTPRAEESNSSTSLDPKSLGFRVIFKYYSSGTLHKVVRRRPFSLYDGNDTSFKSQYSRSFFNPNIKKLTINPKSKKSHLNKKNQNPVFKDKEPVSMKHEENPSFPKNEIGQLWDLEEKLSKKSGGLNKLQKVLKRSNLPPLATSIKNLRIRKFPNN